MLFYKKIFQGLRSIGQSRLPPLSWLVWCCMLLAGWALYQLIVERQAAELTLLNWVLLLWLLLWLFVRLSLAKAAPVRHAGGWRSKIWFVWQSAWLHFLVLLCCVLTLASLFVSIKLAGFIWRTF